MISGTNLVNDKKSEYTYSGFYERVKKTPDAIVGAARRALVGSGAFQQH